MDGCSRTYYVGMRSRFLFWEAAGRSWKRRQSDLRSEALVRQEAASRPTTLLLTKTLQSYQQATPPVAFIPAYVRTFHFSPLLPPSICHVSHSV
jgi:hypothetical protein